MRDLLRPLREAGYLRTDPEQVINDLEGGLLGHAQELARSLLTGIIGTLTGTISIFIRGFGIVFVAVCLLADIRRFKALYLRLAPTPYRDDAAALWDALGLALSRYLGGLAISLAAQGILAWLGLTILGVPYAALLGLWMAVSALVPYVGAWLGAIPSVLLALFISPLAALLTVALYVGINLFEGNFLTPRIQGRAVDVHPLLIFVAVIAGGELFGVAETIFAVTMLAMLRVFFDFFAARVYVRSTETSASTPGSLPLTPATSEASRPPTEVSVESRATSGPDPAREREGTGE